MADKTDPIRPWGATFKGRKLYPCRGLTFWFWWNGRMFDIRNVRAHYGKPSEQDHHYAQPRDLATFQENLAELRTLVGRNNFANVLEQSRAYA